MKRLLKATVVVLLSLLLVAVIWFQNNHSRIWAEFTDQIGSTLSEVAGNPVSCKTARLSPFSSLLLEEIIISSDKTGKTIAEIETIRITPAIMTLFTENVIRISISISGLTADETSAEFVAQLELPKKRTWGETLRATDVKTARLKDGNITFREYHMSNLSGLLELENGEISGGDLLFTFRNEDLLVDFKRSTLEENSFRGRFRSKDYTLIGQIFPEKDTLIIDSFKGTIFSLNANLSGKIVSFSEVGERFLDIKGHVGGKIKDLLSLYMDKEKAHAHTLADVVFTSAFETRIDENNPKDLYLVSDIKADHLSFKDILIEDISGKVSVNSGLVSVSQMTFFLGSHPATIDLSLDTREKSLPLAFTVSAAGMDVGTALSGIETLEKENYGPIDLDISFSGSGKNLYSASSYFSETGTLYPEGNIFTGMEMSGRVRLESYQTEKTRFEDIFTEFSLKNGDLEASKLFFSAYGGKFTGKGGISFLKQDMPVFLDISVTGVDPNLLDEDIFGKENSSEGPIGMNISLKGPGKIISTFIKDSAPNKNGEAVPAFKKVWQTSLLPEYKNELDNIELIASASIASLYVSGVEINNVDLKIICDKSVITVPSFSFRTLGGSLKGKVEISPRGKYIPVSFEVSMLNIDPSDIPRELFSSGDSLTGPFSLDVRFRGSGTFLSDITGLSYDKTEKNKLLPVRKLWRKALQPKYRDLLSLCEISVQTKLQSFNPGGIPIENLDLSAKLKDGILEISSLSLDSQDGTFSGNADLVVDYADFPVRFNSHVKNMDLSIISRKLLNSPGMAEGPADIAFSFSGFGRIFPEISGHIKKLNKTGQFSVADKIRSTLFFLSEKRLFRGQKAGSSFLLKTIRAGKVRFDNIFGELTFNEGRISLPALTGVFYRGAFACNLETDFSTLGFPFNFNADIKGSDLMSLVTDTLDSKSLIYGNLDFNVRMHGKAEYQSSYLGYGAMRIYNADLGRVPILTPLLGWIYEHLEDIFPVFKKINIDSAEASFEIKNREIITDDLVLSGSDISLVAEGTLDFDGKLDFYFENELLEQQLPEDDDWPISIRNFITSFGKTISRARLKGTLKDQKWEFEYLAPIKTAISDNIKAFFKGISR